jgi:ankyrin repeat protein
MERGACIDVEDGEGKTPLHCAGSVGCADTSLAMIDRGADISAKDKYGCTPSCASSA